ncbi:MAG: hypothetical protein A4E53_03508 [Pelotomaculum sp. PtaB.Bin104]|nr:MAG: hypothetical protein A4E53_03508 [Pelotomaculum sp. PtaB.Bin104]
MEWVGNDKEEERACKIRIEDSIVVILCGDVDINKLRECLESVSAMKSHRGH